MLWQIYIAHSDRASSGSNYAGRSTTQLHVLILWLLTAVRDQGASTILVILRRPSLLSPSCHASCAFSLRSDEVKGAQQTANTEERTQLRREQADELVSRVLYYVRNSTLAAAPSIWSRLSPFGLRFVTVHPTNGRAAGQTQRIGV